MAWAGASEVVVSQVQLWNAFFFSRQLPVPPRYWQQAMRSNYDQNAFNIALYRALGRSPPKWYSDFRGPGWPDGCEFLDPNPSGNLSIVMLPQRPYVNLMLVDWKAHYADDAARDAFAAQAIVFHSTCVKGHHKAFYARLYGIAKPAYYAAHDAVLTLSGNTSYNCGSSPNWADVKLAAQAAQAAFMPPRHVFVCGGQAWVGGRKVSSGPRPFHLVCAQRSLSRRVAGCTRSDRSLQVYSWLSLQAYFRPVQLVDPFYSYYRARLVASGRGASEPGAPTSAAAVLLHDHPPLPAADAAAGFAQLVCEKPLHVLYGPGCGEHCE